MSHDTDAEFTQMLHRAPHFGAGGPELLRNSRSAHDQRRVIAQQTNDMAEPVVSNSFRRPFVDASWCWACDRRIMRDLRKLE